MSTIGISVAAKVEIADFIMLPRQDLAPLTACEQQERQRQQVHLRGLPRVLGKFSNKSLSYIPGETQPK